MLLLIILVIMLVGLWATRKFLFGLYRIEGDSMLPTLKHGDFVIVSRLAQIQKDDIVIAQMQRGPELIKRVTRLTPTSVHLEGDNKAESKDSRHFGLVPRKALGGKVCYVIKS